MPFYPEKEKINLHPAFILHHRPYRNTSLIIDVLTREHGRISLVAKGAKQAKSPWRGCLLPFQLLSLSWVKKTDLGTLTHAEITATSENLNGEAMYAAMYVNELLTRLVHKGDQTTEIFQHYVQTIEDLAAKSIAPVLRVFEFHLLQSLGFEIQLDVDEHQHPIEAEIRYKYIPEHGFVISNEKNVYLFEGKHILAFAQEKFDTQDVLQSAQRLMQAALKKRLGDEPLKSRELFIAYKKMSS